MSDDLAKKSWGEAVDETKVSISPDTISRLAGELLETIVDTHNEFTSKHSATDVQRTKAAIAKAVAYKALLSIATKRIQPIINRHPEMRGWLEDVAGAVEGALMGLDPVMPEETIIPKASA